MTPGTIGSGRASRQMMVRLRAPLLALAVAGCGSAASHTATSPATSSTVTSSTATSSTSATVGYGTTGPGSTVTAGTGTITRPATTQSPTTQPPPTTAPRPPAGTGVYGLVTAGPTCPVERPDHPCPPHPVTAEIDARTGSGATAGVTHSDSAGRYNLALRPGTYTLVVVVSGPFPRCPDTPATVTAEAPSRVDISCDTGIR